MNNQSGLDVGVLRNPAEDNNAWKIWMMDTFKSIIPLLSVMDFSKVILHGMPYSDKNRVVDFFENDLRDFLAILERTECELVIDTHQGFVSSLGVALYALQKMFKIPSLDDDSASFANHWEKIVDLSLKQRNNV
jgi:hypothetical protein